MRRMTWVGVIAVAALAGVPTAVVAADGHHRASTSTGSPRADRADRAEKPDQAGAPGRSGSAHAREMQAVARAHRSGMKTWSACVRKAAASGKAHPTAGCVKPLPPGWVKHPDRHRGSAGPGSH